MVRGERKLYSEEIKERLLAAYYNSNKSETKRLKRSILNLYPT
jgi:hypothetical protein